MIGEREILFVVLVGELVVLLHRIKQSLLVPKHSTELDVVRYFIHVQGLKNFVEWFSAIHCLAKLLF